MTLLGWRGIGPQSVALRTFLTVGLLWASRVPLRAIDECTVKTAPQSAFTATCASNICTFTSTTPTPPSGISRLEWSFGDGGSAAGSPGSFSQVAHTYPPAGGYFLVTLTVTDGNGSMSVATQGLVVGGAPVPLAAADAFSTEKDTALTISIDELLANDAPGVNFAGTNGKCVVSGTTCTYQPPAGYVGTDSFVYYVRDATGGSPFAATVTIAIVQPLVANPDAFETGINVPLDLTLAQLTANDLPTTAVVSQISNATHGEASFVELKSGTVIRFTPEHNFGGYAGFDYQISLPGESNTEWGSVSVHVIDQPPTANFIIVGGHCQNRTCTVRPFATDDLGITNVIWNWGDGTPVTEGPAWSDQTHTYAHSGRFMITQTVTDTTGHTASYQLEATANTPPVAVNDSTSTDRDVPVIIPILANDVDQDGDPLVPAAVDVSGYPGATWQFLQNGTSYSLKVTPPDSFVGTMTLTYIVCDPFATCSTPATVTITVNQWPAGLIVDAFGDQFYVGGATFSFRPSSLLVNDYASNTPLHIEGPFDTSILPGRLDCNSEPDLCIYYTAGGGLTLFKYKACDPGLHCDTATVRLYVQTRGHSPTAVDDYFTTTQNAPLNFTVQQVLANDNDSDGDTLSFTIPPTVSWNYGAVTCSTPMYLCTYTPNPGYTGTDRLQYTVWDGINPPVTAFINVTTLPPTTPTFDAREDVRTATGGQIYIPYWSLVANDFDPAGYAISVTAIDTSRLTGSLTCDSGGCLYQYSSPTLTRFSYAATNGHGSSDAAFVRIHVGGNNAPVPAADSLTTPKNVTLRFSTFELLRNDYDADNDPLAATTLPANTAKGTLTCDAKNYWCTYVPKPNATGVDTLSYTVTDGLSNVTSTFAINILP